MKIKAIIFTLFVSFFINGNAQIILNNEVINKRVETNEALFFESGPNIPFEKILLDQYQQQFKISSNKFIVTKNAELEHWIKIPFQIKSRAHWLFQTFTVHADTLDIYIPTSNGYEKRKLGTAASNLERTIQIPELIFELENLRGKQAIYLRIKSKVPVTVQSLFRTEGYFIHYSSRENIFRGLFYGLISAIGLLSLFIFLFSKEKIYLLYALYIFSTVLYNLVQSSVGHFFLWSDYYGFNYILLRYAGLPFLIICSYYYTHHYLETT